MSRTTYKELLDAGVHFGHLKRKWNPSMAPYIFMEKNGIHIIDLHKSLAKLEEAAAAMKQIAASGKKILFVATKKQARDIITERIGKLNMPYITERWTGGMLTNFVTIRKAIRKMDSIDKLLADVENSNLNKKERLFLSRQREKLEKNLGSIKDLTRLPAALFIVDTKKEHIAVAEARKLNIPIFAMVDTNTDPKQIDFPIPSNDDAAKSIDKIIEVLAEAIREGLEDRSQLKAKKGDAVEESPEVEEKAPVASADTQEEEISEEAN
jgi:small subunit ribosomal protein S2